MSHNIGDRVKVSIPDRKRHEWANGAVEKLQGAEGLVTEIGVNARYLVTFDVPVASWWIHGSEHRACWFDAVEIANATQPTTPAVDTAGNEAP